MTANQPLPSPESQDSSTSSSVFTSQTPPVALTNVSTDLKMLRTVSIIDHSQISCSSNTDENNSEVSTTLIMMILLKLWLVGTYGIQMLLINGYSLLLRVLTCIIAIKKIATAPQLQVCVCALVVTTIEGDCGDLERCLAAMAILLIMAGDVEQNPGPIGRSLY